MPDEVYVFELDLDVLIDQMDSETSLVPVFQLYFAYSASDRDIAFFAPTQTSVAKLERDIRKTGGKLLESVQLFDEYRSEKVSTDLRSLAFRLIYRADDRTLTDNDIEPVHQKVREALVEKFRVELRS